MQQFRSIFPDLLIYSPSPSREEFFSWQTCNESHQRFICLRTSAHANIDFFQINFEIITQPQPRIRISAEIFSETLLNKMRAENFSSHSIPRARSRTKDDTGISSSCFCEFGADAASQNNAKKFLAALVSHSNLPEFSTDKLKSKALIAFSHSIFQLAQKYEAYQLALGIDWVATASKEFKANQLAAVQWNQRKSILANCGLFTIAAVTASIAAVTAIKNVI